MEAPLLFATDNTYKRLPLVKNLETVMTFLLQRLKEELHSEPQPRNDEIDRLSSALLELFDGYDSATAGTEKRSSCRGDRSCFRPEGNSWKFEGNLWRRPMVVYTARRERFRAFPAGPVCPWCGSPDCLTSWQKRTCPPSKTCSIFFRDDMKIAAQFTGLRKRFPGSNRPSWEGSLLQISVSTEEERSLR